MSAIERLALVITADGKGAVRELDKVGKSAKKNLGDAEAGAKKVSTQMLAMGAGAAVGGVVALRALDQLAQGAQGTADSIDRAGSIFGDTSAIESWASKQASALGLSSEAALDTASSYGVLLQGVGVVGSTLLKQAEGLSGVTVDLAELYKLDPADVQSKITGALKGTKIAAKALLELGIDITPAKINDEAIRQGVIKAGEKLSREQTVKVTTDIILSSDAKGEFARSLEQGDIGAQQAVAAAKLKNSMDDLGRSVIPVMTKIVSTFGSIANAIQSVPFADELGGVAAYAAALTAVVGAGSAVVGALGKVGTLANKALAVVDGGATAAAAAASTALATAQAEVAATAAAAATAEAALTAATATAGAGSAEAAAASTVLSGAMARQAAAASALTAAEGAAGAAGASKFASLATKIGPVTGGLIAATTAALGFKSAIDGIADIGTKKILIQLPTDEEWAKAFDDVSSKVEGINKPVSTGAQQDVIRYKLLESLRGNMKFDGRGYLAPDPNASQQIEATNNELKKQIGLIGDAKKARDFLEGTRSYFKKRAPDLSAENIDDMLAPATAEVEKLERASRKSSTGLGAIGDAAEQSTSPMQRLADAMHGVNAEADDGKVSSFAQDLDSGLGIIESLADANQRLEDAQARMAGAAAKDAKTVADAYDRLKDAKKALDEALNPDDGSFGLKSVSPEADLADARKRLAEANQKIAVNPEDARALTAKDIAVSDMEAASKRAQEEKRTAKARQRDVEKAREGVADAQKAYNETLANRGQEEQAAGRDLKEAQRGVIRAQVEFGEMVAGTTGGLEGIKKTLDDLAAKGIIPPNLATDFKAQVDKLGAAALDVATKIAKFDPTKPGGGIDGKGAGGNVPFSPSFGNNPVGKGPTPGGAPPAAPKKGPGGIVERKDQPRIPRGGGYMLDLDPALPKDGREDIANNGVKYRFSDKEGMWIPHYAEGGKVGDWKRYSGLLPGSGNTDSIKAMVMPGEFVVSKDATAKYGADFLDGLNAKKFATGGLVAPERTASYRPTSFPRSTSRDAERERPQGASVTFSPTIIQQVRDDHAAGQAVVTALRGVAHRAGRGVRVP